MRLAVSLKAHSKLFLLPHLITPYERSEVFMIKFEFISIAVGSAVDEESLVLGSLLLCF